MVAVVVVAVVFAVAMWISQPRPATEYQLASNDDQITFIPSEPLPPSPEVSSGTADQGPGEDGLVSEPKSDNQQNETPGITTSQREGVQRNEPVALPTVTSYTPARELGNTENPSTPSVPEPEKASEPVPSPQGVEQQASAVSRVEPENLPDTLYWIQVLSSSSRARVEEIRDDLERSSIFGRITAREVDGAVFYRLRYGPFEQKNEAEKYLAEFKGIFEDSYISEEYRS